MAYNLLQRFYTCLGKQENIKKISFLHGIYKQLIISHKGRLCNGEYRRDITNLHPESEERIEFLLNFADRLYNFGMKAHAERLLKQERLKDTYERWQHTLSELEKADPGLKEGVTLYPRWGGVQIDVNGFRRKEPFSASIVLHKTSQGHEAMLYELLPVFNGRWGLKEKSNHDDVFGWLTLEDALSLAQNVRKGDEESFEARLDEIQEQEAA